MKQAFAIFVYLSGLLPTLIAGVLWANEYHAMNGFSANDCDGYIRVGMFLVPGTFLLALGTWLVVRWVEVLKRRRAWFLGTTFLTWAAVVACKVRDFQLNYLCE